MGRNPVVRDAAINYLETHDRATLGEIVNACRKEPGKSNLASESVLHALHPLIGKIIERNEVGGRSEYRLTRRAEVISLKETLDTIIRSVGPDEIEDSLGGFSSFGRVPRIMIVQPAKPHKERVPLDADSIRETSSSDLITRSLKEDFMNLGPKTREQIVRLLGWALWMRFTLLRDGWRVSGRRIRGVRETVKDAAKGKGEFMKDVRKAGGERLAAKWKVDLKAIQGCRNFTLRLVSPTNLLDLLRELLKTDRNGWHSVYVAINDTLEEELKDLVYRPADAIGFGNPDSPMTAILGRVSLPLHVLQARDVLNPLFSFILLESGSAKTYPSDGESPSFTRSPSGDYVKDLIRSESWFGPSDIPSVLGEIRGDLTASEKGLREWREGLRNLQGLLISRRIAVINLWNFPEIETEANRWSVLADFAEWAHGDQDTYTGLFYGLKSEDIKRAYWRVKSGNRPEPAKIQRREQLPPFRDTTLVSNSLAQLYDLHPDGKKPEFWLGILEVFRRREALRNSRNRRILLSKMKREIAYWKKKVGIDDELLSYLAGRYLEYDADVAVLEEPGVPRKIGMTEEQLKAMLKCGQQFRDMMKQIKQWPNPDIGWEKQKIALDSLTRHEWTPYVP